MPNSSIGRSACVRRLHGWRRRASGPPRLFSVSPRRANSRSSSAGWPSAATPTPTRREALPRMRSGSRRAPPTRPATWRGCVPWLSWPMTCPRADPSPRACASAATHLRRPSHGSWQSWRRSACASPSPCTICWTIPPGWRRNARRSPRATMRSRRSGCSSKSRSIPSSARWPVAEPGALVPQHSAETLALLTRGDLPLPYARDILLLSCTVAGTSYRELDDVAPSLAPGQELVLRREPENPHDELAIRVQLADGTLLGYIPRRKNEILARLMDTGKMLVAQLISKEWQGTWLRLEVEVVLREM